MLNTRQRLGFTYAPQRRTQIGLTTKTNYNLGNSVSRDYILENEEMSGEGIIDLAKSGYEKAKNAVEKVAGFYGSETGKKLINMIPSSDENARPGFAGEQHAILKLANGKTGVGNFIGPGTQVVKRVRRNDAGRSAVDVLAMRHDIDYTIAAAEAKDKKQLMKLGRDADLRMIAGTKRVAKNKLDSRANILQAQAISAKVKAEDLGILSRDKFIGDLEKLSDKDLILLKSKRAELSQQGYGNPGEKLKHKLMMKYSGKGCCEQDGEGVYLAGRSNKPRRRQQEISGRGDMDTLVGFISNGLIPNMKKDLGITKNIPVSGIIKILKGKNPSSINEISELLAKMLMPTIVNDKVEQSGSGLGDVKVNKEKAKQIVKKVQPKLFSTLADGIKNALTFYFKKKQSGGGISELSGTGFWANFWKGFKATLRVVGKLALKYGSYVAKASGHPVLATALGAIDSKIAWVKPK
tara:strand:+ start:664 stop:2058 length:1395 start_codon:yes stop_codon:yes gene_type:complete